jgi:hypothetical protein
VHIYANSVLHLSLPRQTLQKTTTKDGGVDTVNYIENSLNVTNLYFYKISLI